MSHEDYMRKALELAKKGIGFTAPNPMVGAVIVKDGKIIGQGYHRKYGDLHAEANAISDCKAHGADCAGADMYVTLEPCCHQGKQPPCTEAIIKSKIKRVFVGSADPNPIVAGKGVKQLRDNGIEVTESVLREECDSINEVFFHYITKKRPFVTMKYAMTMDGKIACYTGASKWITSEASRDNVQHERMKNSAIMVGIGTVLSDDPRLTCRVPGGKNPLRIICDSSLRTPLESNVVHTAKNVPTLIATVCSDADKIAPYEEAGCTVVTVPKKAGHVDLEELMRVLGEEMNIDSILLEGGGELNWGALNAGIVQKVQVYISPKLFGGSAKTPIGGRGVPIPSEAFMLDDRKIFRCGDDLMIESRVRNVHRDS